MRKRRRILNLDLVAYRVDDVLCIIRTEDVPDINWVPPLIFDEFYCTSNVGNVDREAKLVREAAK